MNTPSPSRWSDLFEIAVSIIAQANKDFTAVNNWSFGGGTALMLQINHRESHDVDIFIDDPQVLPYLNPETQDYTLSIAPSTYETDGTQSLKIVFDSVGEIDFICSLPLLDRQLIQNTVCDIKVDLETPAEIIAKKVYHRGARLQPRDIFDIAAVAHTYGDDYLVKALCCFPDQVQTALSMTENYSSAFISSILAGLNVYPEFEMIRGSAQADTIKALKTVLKHSGTHRP